jgi:hypothetical protein
MIERSHQRRLRLGYQREAFENISNQNRIPDLPLMRLRVPSHASTFISPA